MKQIFNTTLLACVFMVAVNIGTFASAETSAGDKAKEHNEKPVNKRHEVKDAIRKDAAESKAGHQKKHSEKRDVRKNEMARKRAENRRAWDKLTPAERARARAFHEGREEVNGQMQEMHPGELEELREQYQ